jgi:hypothetical protein
LGKPAGVLLVLAMAVAFNALIRLVERRAAVLAGRHPRRPRHGCAFGGWAGGLQGDIAWLVAAGRPKTLAVEVFEGFCST